MADDKVTLDSLQLLMNRKKQRKKIFQILFYLAQALSDLTENIWKMESSSKKVCSKYTHMEVIHEHSYRRCADSCSGEWLNCALEVFQENKFILHISILQSLFLEETGTTGLQLYQQQYTVTDLTEAKP